MAFFTSIVDELGAISEQLSRGRDVKQERSLPQKLHILANWAMTDADKVYIGYNTQNDNTVAVPFGDINMYPWPFRNSADLDYVQIDPAITPTDTTVTPSQDVFKYATASYCYAIEAVLDLAPDSPAYSGVAAFTMAYAPDVAITSSYEASVFNIEPHLIIQGGNFSKRVYLFITLARVENSTTDFILTFKIQPQGEEGQKTAFTVFTYTFKDISTNNFALSRKEGGISGLIDTQENVTGDKPLTVSNLQIIFPDEEATIVKSGNTNTEKRKLFINHYAFDYDKFVDTGILTKDPTTPWGNNPLPPAQYIYNKTSDDTPLTPTYFVAYRVGSDGTRPTRIERQVQYRQPVIFDLMINFGVRDTASIVWTPFSDMAHREKIYRYKLNGGLSSEFPRSGQDSLGNFFYYQPNRSGDIIWKYTEITTIGNLSYKTARELTGTMSSEWQFFDSNFKQLSLLSARDPSQGIDLETAINRWQKAFKSHLLSPDEKSFISSTETDFNPQWNAQSFQPLTVDDVTKFADQQIKNINSISDNLGVFASYVLYSPPSDVTKADYWEFLFFDGYDSPGLLGLIKGVSTNLQFARGAVLTISQIQKNKILRMPAALYGRATESDVLTEWKQEDIKAFATTGIELQRTGK